MALLLHFGATVWNMDWAVRFFMAIWKQEAAHMQFEVGSTVYIVESNRIVSEVTVVKRSGDFYTVRFGENGGIQVRGSRLYATQEDAEASLAKNKRDKIRYSSPYDYWH